jgi:type I restriction enzyme S subunit
MTKWERLPMRALVEQRRTYERVRGGAEYRLLGVRWYGGGVFIRETVESTTTSATQLQPANPGDLVYNRLFAWKQSFALLGNEHRGCYASNEFPMFKVSATADARFLMYSLLRDEVSQIIDSESTGATSVSRNRWAESSLRQLTVPVPPLEEQRRIADFLDNQVSRIDRALALRQRQAQLANERVVAWVSAEFDRLADEFGLFPVRHALIGIRQGWSPQCEDRVPAKGEWGVLKAGCVNGGVFRADEIKALPVDVDPRPEFLVSEGDLLVNRASGSLDLIGSAAVVGGDLRPRTLLCDKVYRLVLTNDMDAGFFAALWTSRQVRELLRLDVSGAEGMANSLPSGVIRAISLPRVPPLTQKSWTDRYTNVVDATARLTMLLESQVRLLRERKGALITAAVTGEFDVTAASGGTWCDGPN